MCIIVVKPRGKRVTKAVLKKCWDNNRDGAGFMYAKNGQVIIRKGYFSFDRFWDRYSEEVLHGPGRESDVVIHFRIRTSGKIDSNNAHPHRIHAGLAFAHNGMINIPIPRGSSVSDTIIFRDSILKKLPKDWLDYESIRDLVADKIGRSKLAFLDGQGRGSIINRHMGETENGCWFSNTSYRGYRMKTTATRFMVREAAAPLPIRVPAAVLAGDAESTITIPGLDETPDEVECNHCGAVLETAVEQEYETCNECGAEAMGVSAEYFVDLFSA